MQVSQFHVPAFVGGIFALAMTASVASAQTADTLSTGQPKVKLTLYGQVNKAMLFVGDGKTSRSMIVDNAAGSTRLGFTADAPVNADFSFGAQLEVEQSSNNSGIVTLQGNGDNNRANTTFTERVAEITMTHKRFGKVSLGQGSVATDGIVESDLSNTAISGNYADSATIGTAILFYNSTTRTTSGSPTVGDVINSLNGNLDDRIRYDTPTIAGFTASAAFVSGGAADAALRYATKLGDFELAAALGYYNLSGLSTTTEDRVVGSASVLHASGLNATISAGTQNHKGTNRDDGSSLYGKVGYIAKVFGVGSTNFGVDYGVYDDYGQNGDTAKTYSLGVVQQFDDIGSQIYLLGKIYELDRIGASYDDVKLVMTGVRVAF